VDLIGAIYEATTPVAESWICYASFSVVTCISLSCCRMFIILDWYIWIDFDIDTAFDIAYQILYGVRSRVLTW